MKCLDVKICMPDWGVSFPRGHSSVIKCIKDLADLLMELGSMADIFVKRVENRDYNCPKILKRGENWKGSVWLIYIHV